jgi:CHAT domain-containing protein
MNLAASLEPSQILTVSLPNEAKLPHTAREIRCITMHAGGVPIVSLDESAATPQSVSKAMEQSEWVHLACHGEQHFGNPTESYLLLANGSKLKLSDIIKLRLENAQLAFLSACQTATGDEGLDDEAVHLAAGMLLSGYRGVIATMWKVDDEYAADIADETYRILFREYDADSTRAAEALHRAVEKVRKERAAAGDNSFSWVPFVYFGI